MLIAAISVAAGLLGGCARPQARGKVQELGITKGPALLRVYRDRAAVMWETEIEGSCKLYYGRRGEAERCVESKPERASYEIKEKGKETIKKTAYIHKVWIENLEAGELYEYRVTGPQIESAAYELRTAPADTNRVRFVVYGDTRTHPETHRKLVEQMIRKKPDFVVHVGDLATSGNKYEQWGPQHFEVMKGLAENVPVYIAKGNHEGDNGNYEKLLIPPGEGNSFGFDYGPAHYFCLDNYTKGKEAKELVDQIVRDSAGSDAEWKFVIFHIPSLNLGHHWSAWGHPDALPSFARAGVDFVLAGHSHQYERFRPIEPPKGAEGGYVTYITTGGGGAPLGQVKPSEYHAYAKSTNEFCLFDIQGDRLTMDVIDIKGEVIDRLRLTKSGPRRPGSGGRLNKEYIDSAVPMEEIQQVQKANLGKQN